MITFSDEELQHHGVEITQGQLGDLNTSSFMD